MTQVTALETLIRSLNNIHARYLIVGSVASSAQGIPRFTRDTDLVVQIRSAQTALLAKALGADWYLDADFARESIERGRAFNVIHIPSGHKFDIFPARDAFNQSELDRATMKTVTIPGGNVTCYVATAEDMILAKLRWYRDGGEVSDAQWNDIAGMLVTNRDLDVDYLNQWADKLKVADLLQRAIEQSQDFS